MAIETLKHAHREKRDQLNSGPCLTGLDGVYSTYASLVKENSMTPTSHYSTFGSVVQSGCLQSVIRTGYCTVTGWWQDSGGKRSCSISWNLERGGMPQSICRQFEMDNGVGISEPRGKHLLVQWTDNTQLHRLGLISVDVHPQLRFRPLRKLQNHKRIVDFWRQPWPRTLNLPFAICQNNLVLEGLARKTSL